MADAHVLERRRDRVWALGVRRRRRAWVRDACTGGGAHTGDASLSLHPPAGLGDDRRRGVPRLLLPLPRLRAWPALRAGRALNNRYGAATGRRAELPAVLRPRRRDGERDPRVRRLDLSPRGLALGAQKAAGRVDGLASRAGVHPERLDRLQRGDAPVRPRARIPDLPGRRGGLERLDQSVPLGLVLRPRARELRPALRPSVLAHLDRLPRDPRRVHARARYRLLRELAAGDAVAAGVRHAQSERVARLRAEPLG